MKINLDMERIKERQKLAWQGMFYSIQRIDLLIISISGAGIYVCLETLKYMFENNLTCDLIIKLSGLSFLLCIGINFVSQIYGSKTNYYDYLWCEEKIDCEDNPNDEQTINLKEYDEKSERYSKATRILTNISIVLMMVGLCFLLVYFFFIF